MRYLDQTITVDDEHCPSDALQSLWTSLEQAAKNREANAAPAMGKLGAELGRSLFPPSAHSTSTLISNLAIAQRHSSVLRLRFAGPAARLPVEFALLPNEVREQCKEAGVVMDDTALALLDRVELIREAACSRIASACIDTSDTRPLRILIAVANPGHERWKTIPRAEAQARQIESACRGLGGGYVSVCFLSVATPSTLARSLGEFRPDVVHFVGHGATAADQVSEPSLVLSADRGQGVEYFSAQDLLGCFSDRPRLVSLNACHLGGSAPSTPGFAHALSDAGVPMVLAMQLPVEDTVAEHVAEGVYRAMLRGLPVSLAVANVRRQFAIDSRLRNYPQWATPVLLSQSADTTVCRGIPVTGVTEARSRSAAQQFVGREWLWDKIKPRLESPYNAITLLEAEAGLGKSCFVERCFRELDANQSRHGSVSGAASLPLIYRYRYGEQSDAAACARSLGDQLRAWLSESDKPKPERRAAADYSSPYAHACAELDDVLSAATQHVHVVLFVDALDEAYDAQDALPIANRADNLWDNLSVFVTARPEWYRQWRKRHPPVTDTEQVIEDERFAAVVLEPLSTANLRDVAYFIHRRFQPYGLAISQAACLELAREIRGSFLVADIVLGMLRKGDDMARVKGLFHQAESVTGAYDLVFRTLAADLAGDRDARRRLHDTEDLLAFITCAQEPVAEEQLRYLFEARSRASSSDTSRHVADALHHLRRFLASELSEYGEPLYRPYHQSLRTYGQRRLRPAPTTPGDEARPMDPSLPIRADLPHSVVEYQKIWADFCMAWPRLDRYSAVYALRQLVPHLLAIPDDESLDEAERVLTDYSYISAALGADPSTSVRPLHVNELIARYDDVERLRAAG